MLSQKDETFGSSEDTLTDVEYNSDFSDNSSSSQLKTPTLSNQIKHAICNGNLDAVKVLISKLKTENCLEGTSVEDDNLNDSWMLTLAARRCKTDILLFLLQEDIQYNAVDEVSYASISTISI